ncbi:hypothetical protein [Campylobacter fetus]|uniref:hypothetical protein n=1 Tax=Campylobacter fetus TaxID=196 RepID=UPI003AF78DD1
MQRYCRFKDGKFLKYTVALPFSDELHSFSEFTDFSALKKAGYYKFKEVKPTYDPYTQKEASVEIIKLNEDECTLQYTYAPLSEAEQIAKFGQVVDLNFLKEVKIKALNESMDAVYKAYLKKYPEIEQQSFTQKAQESFKVIANIDTPLNDTPYLANLTNNNKAKRDELAINVNAKVVYITALEAFGVAKRDEIKAATSIANLNKISLELPNG